MNAEEWLKGKRSHMLATLGIGKYRPNDTTLTKKDLDMWYPVPIIMNTENVIRDDLKTISDFFGVKTEDLVEHVFTQVPAVNHLTKTPDEDGRTPYDAEYEVLTDATIRFVINEKPVEIAFKVAVYTDDGKFLCADKEVSILIRPTADTYVQICDMWLRKDSERLPLEDKLVMIENILGKDKLPNWSYAPMTVREELSLEMEQDWIEFTK